MIASKLPVVILARGGSRGIPGKNLVEFCGRPLLTWTIDFALSSRQVSGVWVSTDDAEISRIARKTGAQVIDRPESLSSDQSSSESGWLHATSFLSHSGVDCESFVGLQPTSPLRLPGDLDSAIIQYREESLDSLFSASRFEDLTLWAKSDDDHLFAVNHDSSRRLPRQHQSQPIVENGSIYIMKQALLESSGSRFSGRLDFAENNFWQAIEIDSRASLEVCEVLMNHFVLGR